MVSSWSTEFGNSVKDFKILLEKGVLLLLLKDVKLAIVPDGNSE
jgi:hypothetical protein